MPLTGNVSQNIHELVHHGKKERSHKQIVAIAIDAAKKKGKYARLEEFIQNGMKKKKPSKEQTQPLKTPAITTPITLDQSTGRVGPDPGWEHVTDLAGQDKWVHVTDEPLARNLTGTSGPPGAVPSVLPHTPPPSPSSSSASIDPGYEESSPPPSSSPFTGDFPPFITGVQASGVPQIPIGTNRSSIQSHPDYSGGIEKAQRWGFFTPDDLYAETHGKALETFVAPTSEEVYRAPGRNTHYDILSRMRMESGNPSEIPRERSLAVNEDWVLGRVGTVAGHRVTSFWNNSYQEPEVKAYVLQQIKEGRLHPDYDLISFRGHPGFIRAGDFVNYTSTEEEKAARQWTPEELARAHVDPALKAQILGSAARKYKANPWADALRKLGLLAPGHNWRYPLEAQRPGIPAQFAKKPSMVEIVREGIKRRKKKEPEEKSEGPVRNASIHQEIKMMLARPQETTLHIGDMVYDPANLDIAIHDVHQGNTSQTKGPLQVKLDPEIGKHFLVDGYHRLIEGLLQGNENHPVQVTGTTHGSGYFHPNPDSDLFGMEKLPHGFRLGQMRPKQFARPLPSWVPEEHPDRPDETGWVHTPSSWIAGLKYTRDRGTEMMVKKGGKTYQYPGFTLKMFRQWLKAKSPGKWWWRNIGYPMREHHQLSMFTGMVHPLLTHEADHPMRHHPLEERNAYYSHDEIMDWLRRHVHPGITDAHASAIVGALPMTHTNVMKEKNRDTGQLGMIGYGHQLAGHEPLELTFSTYAPGYNVMRTIKSRTLSNLNQAELHNDHMIVDPFVKQMEFHPGLRRWISSQQPNPFRGVSGSVLLRQMRAAYEMGIPRIHWYSAWTPPHARAGDPSGDFTGGLHWPMIGADGFVPNFPEIPQIVVDDADKASNGRFSATRQFSDFFKSPYAKIWYQRNPDSHSSWVDTTPGSYSRTAVERHVAEHAVKKGMQGPIPDAAMHQQPLPMNPAEARMHDDYENDYYYGAGDVTKSSDKVKMSMAFHYRPRYHEAIEHLLATGSLHPEHFDLYFNK